MTPSELRELRKRCRLTIIELSKKSGVAQADISEYERGEKELSADLIKKLEHTVGWPEGFSDN